MVQVPAAERRLVVANVLEEARFGGPQRRVGLVGERLAADHGVDTVAVVAKRDGARTRAWLADHGVAVRSLGLNRLSKAPGDALRFAAGFPGEMVALSRLLRELRPDLVHVNGSWQWKGLLAAHRLGLPCVWHLNDTAMPGPVNWVFRRLARRRGDGFIVAAERVADYYLSGLEGVRPVVRIDAPVDTRRFDPDRVAPDPAIAQLPGLKCVMVGNMNPVKGHDVVLDAMAHLRARAPEQPVSLVLVGPFLDSHRAYGEGLRDRCRRDGLDTVHFWGGSDAIERCLVAADVYVCASRFEASPMAVWEAMAMGLPVVSTDVGDVAQVLGAAGLGAAVPPGDAAALAEALAAMVARPAETRRAMGAAARRMAERRFTVEAVAARHAAFYRGVLDRPAA
ncbi:hypothetical protein CCR85_02480 [Rhodothalassium salexigens]|uniref:glycosyltransferase n=1 Tax=Rhodothalassium salexigens TaxID=1086 RepID=UPI001911C45A|nr:glycosyltransferase [Rhodothalassium salexigens]MBK5910356.1 hypothetical protein [Rhodothalassium salexigens]